MPNYNKVILMGNLTRDPALTYLPGNLPVVDFGLAVNHRRKRQDGTQVDEAMFIDCRAFGKTAEMVSQYFRKGRPILVEGRLQLDQWTDKEGQKRSKHRVTVDNFTFADTKADAQSHGGARGDQGAGHYGGGDHGGSAEAPAPRSSVQPQHSASPEPMPEMAEDDIPF